MTVGTRTPAKLERQWMGNGYLGRRDKMSESLISRNHLSVANLVIPSVEFVHLEGLAWRTVREAWIVPRASATSMLPHAGSSGFGGGW